MLTGKVKTNPYSRLSSFMSPLFCYSLSGLLYSYSFFTPGWPCPSLHLISLLSVSHLLFLHSPFQVSSFFFFFFFETPLFEAILCLSNSAFGHSTPHTHHHVITAFSCYLLTLAREACQGWPAGEMCSTTWRQPHLHLVLPIKKIIHVCIEATDLGVLATSRNNLPKMSPNEGLVFTMEPNAFVLCQDHNPAMYHSWISLPMSGTPLAHETT